MKFFTTFAFAIVYKALAHWLLVQAVGPFVYRLGRKIFILERGVRFPYGLLIKTDRIKY